MMYLLDTHIVIWLAQEPQKLDERLKALLLNKNVKVYFSTVNLWEVAIKKALGKAGFDVDVKLLYQHLIENQYLELPVLSGHCLLVQDLPLYHKDPFDRLIIAQAMSENFTLITEDTIIPQYPNLKLFK
ncbi:type II toxin-antitoxin system VapC family toxin [Moraxella sp. K127]|nr:type II toxin-antitoxin system VapC family toxin [Moraxella sp. K1664]MBE9588511.1 type II toxin-antitoxin system VapC family toxin [Moraxella sp. K1630]MBE9589862.1 type II toxin-antitoxin system VapC family toxin [Moraxella sp. K127]MBE9596704.1 type II toxin-antitoxin system VapC family toxin [Moraxella sp. K2450]MDI4482827.1 type II toxin-antitoxin system VapC family toxin [Moraxella lacunata]